MKWLSEDVLNFETRSQALRLLVKKAEQQRMLLLEITRMVWSTTHKECYAGNMKLFHSIPGFRFITAITFLTVLETIERFPNSGPHFASFTGPIPSRYSSEEKDITGEMTFRGQDHLRKAIIESSWVSVRIDPVPIKAYHDHTKRMEPNKAIVKIGRKLLNRMYYILKFKQEYVKGVVK